MPGNRYLISMSMRSEAVNAKRGSEARFSFWKGSMEGQNSLLVRAPKKVQENGGELKPVRMFSLPHFPEGTFPQCPRR